jgi:carotenoid 1,2-hydratase
LETEKASSGGLLVSSSLAADVWHPNKGEEAYEWWYFDALSDGHDEAVVIVFSDNYIYSSRYNGNSRLQGGPSLPCPAVTFTYFSSGKQVYRAECEFPANAFRANELAPECDIGDNHFHFKSAPYGSGYVVSLDLQLPKDRRLQATFEWLAIESDFSSAPFLHDHTAHCWNLVAPRCDVSGHFRVTDSRGMSIDDRSFRGTGFHDHNLGNRPPAETIRGWGWGRAHFNDLTAVYCRYAEKDKPAGRDELVLIHDDEFRIAPVRCDEAGTKRSSSGLKYPTRLTLTGEGGLRLDVQPLKMIDSGLCNVRLLSELRIAVPGGREHETIGISEFICPQPARNRWLRWLRR